MSSNIDLELNKLLATEILKSIPSGVIVFDSHGKVLFLHGVGQTLMNQRNMFEVLKLEQVANQQKVMLGHSVEIEGNSFIVNAAPLNVSDKMNGVITLIEEASVYQSLLKEVDLYKTTIQDLQTIFDNSYDVLYVADGRGITLRASSACEALWGKKPDELIGRSVYELEKEGVYYPSATRLALERGQKVQIVQQTKTGRKLMVVSTPIRDFSGNIVRVVNASRDISEIHKLEQEIQSLKDIVAGYRLQLSQLQENKNKETGQLVYRSRVMEEIITLLDRVSLFDSTILISGESGVGKEIIANYIHSRSPRSEKPFIKINCAAIPESLLESELFGYEAGTFTGAQKNGKAGLFELANAGTLFLDEIGDMPLGLQAKLLRVLQEREIMRVGGRKAMPIDVRIVAATNQNLTLKVKDGTFREDLYYRLNVIPVHIPALRERKEDILPLIHYFQDYFIAKFNHGRITFSQNLLLKLESYHWSGNIRELRNVVERLVVTAKSGIIDSTDLPENIVTANDRIVPSSKEMLDAIDVKSLVPLKEALHMVETKLIRLASETCKTTSEIAQVLGVNQSTISRKLNKYNMQIDMQ